MKKLRNSNTTILTLCLAVLSLTLATACSEVSFAPSLLTEKVKDGDGSNNTRYKFTESFTQTSEEAKVDILVVIDNSGSMAAEQEKMGDRIQSFLGHLRNVDWQIGITTTDLSAGPFATHGELLDLDGQAGNILRKGDPNYLRTFLNTVTRDESTCDSLVDCGSGQEQPLAASVLAMQLHDSSNSGFFRADADTAIVILSDEDEMSTGPDTATHPLEVINTHEDIWGGTSKKLSVSGIIIRPGDTACYDTNSPHGGNYGDFVDDLVARTDGYVGSICEDDYGLSLRNIGKRVEQLSRSLELAQLPDPDSMIIEFTPVENAVDWSIEGSMVKFKKPPVKDTKVTIHYNLFDPDKDKVADGQSKKRDSELEIDDDKKGHHHDDDDD